VAYVHIPGCCLQAPNCEYEVVPIVPQKTSFVYKPKAGVSGFYINRSQLPIVPAYAYTDYKSQGRSLDCAILDLASSRTLQGIYIMLSRVKDLRGVAILCPFRQQKIYQRLSQEIRDELARLHDISHETSLKWHESVTNGSK
jgi:ATP-dependent exoDNAse (exonuclease V) alpha subunit